MVKVEQQGFFSLPLTPTQRFHILELAVSYCLLANCEQPIAILRGHSEVAKATVYRTVSG